MRQRGRGFSGSTKYTRISDYSVSLSTVTYAAIFYRVGGLFVSRFRGLGNREPGVRNRRNKIFENLGEGLFGA